MGAKVTEEAAEVVEAADKLRQILTAEGSSDSPIAAEARQHMVYEAAMSSITCGYCSAVLASLSTIFAANWNAAKALQVSKKNGEEKKLNERELAHRCSQQRSAQRTRRRTAP